MRVMGSIDEMPKGMRFALTIGMFDGLHRGHQRALRTLVRVARQQKAESVVLTFEPHPAQVLRGSAPPLLADPAEKLARFEAIGIDATVVQRFDEQFAAQPPDVFLERICDDRDLTTIVMTAESSFGRDRTGILTTIKRLGRAKKFEVVEVERVERAGSSLSSTTLRTLIGQGQLNDVRRLLGRRYAVTGTVVTGDRRGRALGYPTANLDFEQPVALPMDGIYAVRASWGGNDPLDPARISDGVASLGVRPTFGGGKRLLEVYLFDFDGNLYGERMRVEFVRRLRGEKKFDSAESLVKQMDRDAARARAVLAQLR